MKKLLESIGVMILRKLLEYFEKKYSIDKTDIQHIEEKVKKCQHNIVKNK
jgi:hypothetical protein